MVRANWLRWLVAAVALSTPACVTCEYDAHAKALCPDLPCTDAPASSRNRVYVFLMNDSNPFGLGDMASLRKQLVDRGFGSVYYGQLYHGGYYEKQIKAIHTSDAGARFVVVGWSLGAPAADALTARLLKDGIAVDALVTIDPVYLLGFQPTANLDGVPDRIVLTTKNRTGIAVPQAQTRTITVPDAGRYSMPTHPVTVSTIEGVLQEVVQLVPLDDTAAITYLPLLDDPAPLPAFVPDGPARESPLVRKQAPVGELTGRPK